MYKNLTLNASGDDAFEFLQGQLSNDLRRLDIEDKISSAWCNPKGRVIWFGEVQKTASGYALSVPAAIAESMVKRLTMFRFRAKVNFDVIDEGVTLEPLDLIQSGVPYIGSEQTEQFTPHMLNLDLLDAISLDKGCYTGQEIVARTHYKGATKRRTMRFASDAEAATGAKISDGSRDIGEVLNVSANALLGVVATSKTGGELQVGNDRLQVVALPYALDDD